MKRPAATLLIIGSTVFMLVTGLAVALVVMVAVQSINPVLPNYSGTPPPVASGSPAAPAGERHGDYTFGHTAAAISPGGDSVPINITERMPFTLDADVTSMRLHVRNWNYITDTALPGTVNLSGIAIGKAASGQIPGDSSAFSATPAVFSGATSLTDGEEFVSDWVSADTVGFEKSTPFFLSVGMSAAPGTKIGVSTSVSWFATDSQPSAVTTQDSVGDFIQVGPFLDMWMDYTYSGDEPLIVVAGHSLNSGANNSEGKVPHTGENSSWHQVWADANGAVAASLSTPGSLTTQFAPDSPKWNIYTDLDPDAFVLWSASNDIANGVPFDELKTAWLATLGKAKELWPNARVFVMTEPGRGLAEQREGLRVAWNDWLKSDTSGDFTVVDADAALSDPAQPDQLDPAINGDGIHPSPAGFARVADAFETAYAAG
ncbi:GDSL-type esterase/lipase family protein [Subtercola boreus]|nr:GDSL-type esterase/lipase family protein [Subtercola boreus]TQL53198.1 GDSL-like lipase/acylhydrolase family protein [Subtercola boreus]